VKLDFQERRNREYARGIYRTHPKRKPKAPEPVEPHEDTLEAAKVRSKKLHAYVRSRQHWHSNGKLKHRDEMCEDLGFTTPRLLMRYLREAGLVDILHEHIVTYYPFKTSTQW
jgi:hypothetical protein